MRRIELTVLALMLVCMMLFVCSCSKNNAVPNTTDDIGVVPTDAGTESRHYMANVEFFDTTFSERDTSGSYFERVYEIDFNAFDRSAAGETEFSNNILRIMDYGTYVITGTLNNGRIIVEADKDDEVQLVLSGVDLSCAYAPAIIALSASKVYITLADNTDNKISDGETYDVDGKCNAAIYSASDLTINGNGDMEVLGRYMHGIATDKKLVISNCTLNVIAKQHGIHGGDCVKTTNAIINVRSNTSAIVSDNTVDENLGYVFIESGIIALTADRDGIYAGSAVIVTSGTITIESGIAVANDTNGRKDSFQNIYGDEEELNGKAIHAGLLFHAKGGLFYINSVGECVYTNGDIALLGGSFTMNSSSNGMSAESHISIEGSTVKIAKCNNGICALTVDIKSGVVNINSSDDGINCGGGNDVHDDVIATIDAESYVRMRGGIMTIRAEGDGLDVRGDVYIESGTIVISASQGTDNLAIDYSYTATINGGTVIACGNAENAKPFITSSTQSSFMYCFNTPMAASSRISVADTNGNVVISFEPSNQFSCIMVSCAAFSKGTTYKLMSGGTIGETDEYGLATAGVLTDGILIDSIELKYTSTIFAAEGGVDGNNPEMPDQPGGNPLYPDETNGD